MPLRLLVTMVSAVIVGFVGTVAHRMGVPYNLPYGLVLSLMLIGISAWSARARSGSIGLGFHLIASGAVVWMITQAATTTRALVIFGYTTDAYSFWMQKAGIILLLGMVAVQVILVMLSERLFRVPPRIEQLTKR